MERASSTFVSRCSLVVRPVDAWTGRAVSGADIRVAVAEAANKPIRTSDGSYAFLDLPLNSYTVTVQSPVYLDYSAEVELSKLPPREPLVLAPLLPNRTYRPPAAGTGIAFRVLDKLGKPLAGVTVSAYADADAASRGRLSEPETAAGAAAIRFLPGGVKPADGEALVIRERESDAAEWCRVRLTESDFALALERPLGRAWRRGAMLYPAAATRSDRDGYVLLPFRGRLPETCDVHAELRHEGKTVSVRLKAEGGSTVNREPVVLQ